MSSFTVRPYEPGDEEGILRLFNEVFSEGNPGFEPRTLDTWEHIYSRNPYERQVLVATDADGAIIANYSAIPVEMSVNGERRPSSQPVDTCVHKDWRGSLRKNSVFVTIAREFVREFCTTGAEFYNEIMWGLPNEKAFPVGTRIIGYQPVHCPMPRQVGAASPEWIDALVARAEGVSVEPAGAESLAEIAALFEACVDEAPLGTWRSEEYLAWRYRDWPGVDYQALLARRDGELVGALIYRLGWFGQPIVPLVDWIGRGGDVAATAALLAEVSRITVEAGGSRLETWTTPNMARNASLLDLGLAQEASPFNLCIMVFSATFDLDWAKRHWVFCMGDSDIY